MLEDLDPVPLLPGVLLISAYDVDACRPWPVGTSVHRFLRKPVPPQTLIDAVAGAVAVSSSSRSVTKMTADTYARSRNTMRVREVWSDMSDSPTPMAGDDLQVLRILLVDDHDVLRAGTRQVLETYPDMLVVGEASDGNTALAVVDELAPDVVLIDLRLPDRDGIDVARQLKVTHPPSGSSCSPPSATTSTSAALEAGVTGYLLKTMPRHELVNAVRAASQGNERARPDPWPAWRECRRLGPAPSSRSGLTWREGEIVTLVAEGLTNKAIAARLEMSVRTVEGHINHVFTKLGVESRTELARLVLTQGIVPPGHPTPAAALTGP